jgi:hypothetical protein
MVAQGHVRGWLAEIFSISFSVPVCRRGLFPICTIRSNNPIACAQYKIGPNRLGLPSEIAFAERGEGMRKVDKLPTTTGKSLKIQVKPRYIRLPAQAPAIVGDILPSGGIHA